MADEQGADPAPKKPRKPRKVVEWTKAKTTRFFDELAATCLIGHSAAAAGVSASSVYGRRRTHPAFAAAWGEAVAHGYEVLETRTLGHILAGGGPTIAPDDPSRPPIDVELALKLLREVANRATGKRALHDGPPPRIATREDTNQAILKKLRAIEARVAQVEPDAPRSAGTADDAA